MPQDSLNNCPVSRECGGCKYINGEYEQSLKSKEQYIRSLLKGIVEVEEIVGCDNPYNYRNKVHAAFGRDKKGKVIYGTYAQGSHRIIPNPKCCLENKVAASIIKDIAGLLPSFKLQVYDERTGNGILRRVLIRTADKTGQVMVVIVVGSKMFPGKNNFVKALVKKHPEITTVVVNYNMRRDSMILGDKSEVCYGKGFIVDELCGLKFRISPESFYQINRDQAQKLYELAISMGELKSTDRIIDAYCGTGTIGLYAASSVKQVVGVELNNAAVKDAISNSRANDIKNALFRCGDAGQFMVSEAGKKEHYDAVILDPPRSGTTPEFINSCEKLGPDRIVYVSCGPETLARDLKLFAKAGYKAVKAVPVDMFPWTEHTEVVVCMQKI